MKHFYARDHYSGKLVEMPEDEFLSVFGDKRIRAYAGRVIRGSITIDAVPEDLREAVAQSVAARRERFGTPADRPLSDAEALKIILGGDAV